MASTYTKLLYHIVYSTKERRPLITPDLREPLYKYIGGIIRGEGAHLIEIGGVQDHIHIVAKLKPIHAPAELIKIFKSKSSKWVNETPGRDFRFEWQTGYGAFTVSPSQLPTLIEYVRNQEEHHRKLTFQEEFIVLLKKHGIEYNERYLWN